MRRCRRFHKSCQGEKNWLKCPCGLRRLRRRGVTGVYFTNANFNNDYQEAERLCDGMVRARLGLQWSDCVNFREIDEALYQCPKVCEAVSLGIPDEYRGETVKAFVVLKLGETATESEIIDFCKQKLTKYKVPTVVEFRDSLPKSAVGKILRKTLRQEESVKLKK